MANQLPDKSITAKHLLSELIAVSGKPIANLSNDYRDTREDVLATSMALHAAYTDLKAYIDKLTGVAIHQVTDIPTISINLISHNLDSLQVDSDRGLHVLRWEQIGNKRVYISDGSGEENILAIARQNLETGTYLIVLNIEEVITNPTTRVVFTKRKYSGTEQVLKTITTTGIYTFEITVHNSSEETYGLKVLNARANERVTVAGFKVYRVTQRLQDYFNMKVHEAVGSNEFEFITLQQLTDSNFKDGLVTQEQHRNDLTHYVKRTEVDGTISVINKNKIAQMSVEFRNFKEYAEATYATKTSVISNGVVVDLDDYLTKDIASQVYAQKAHLPNMDNYLPKAIIENDYVKKIEVNNYITIPDLSDTYITITNAQIEYATKQQLANTISNYPTKLEVSNIVDTKLIGQFDSFVSKTWANENLVSKLEASNHVTIADISGFISATDVLTIYLPRAEASTTYATKNTLDTDYYKSDHIDTTFATKAEVEPFKFKTVQLVTTNEINCTDRISSHYVQALTSDIDIFDSTNRILSVNLYTSIPKVTLGNVYIENTNEIWIDIITSQDVDIPAGTKIAVTIVKA